MDTILTDDVWKQVAAESKLARRPLVAVAYVTSEKNLKLKQNDLLICDASDAAIRTGQTSAPLLKSLAQRGVELRSHGDLHAKAAVFGRYALIGSSNLSPSSENTLTELAIFTDRDQIVAQVTSFIYGL
jgi:phosphatidylserine/phosphatidylglycerophosphate/cardiolipin synthase-like enzyme